MCYNILFFRFHRNDKYIEEMFRTRTNFLIKKDLQSKLIDIGPVLGLTLGQYLSFESVLHYGMDFSFYWILPQRRPISFFTKLLSMDHLGLIVTSVLVILLALILTWWALVRFDMSADFSFALTMVTSICLSLSPPFAPASRKMRMLLMFCFGAFIPLDVAVQSLLTSTLTEPYREPKLNNIWDLARSDLIMNYQYGLGENIFDGLDNNTREMIGRKSVPLINNEVKQIELISGTKRMAVLVPMQKLFCLRNYKEAEIIKQVRSRSTCFVIFS